jgi:hypothetical protein
MFISCPPCLARLATISVLVFCSKGSMLLVSVQRTRLCGSFIQREGLAVCLTRTENRSGTSCQVRWVRSPADSPRKQQAADCSVNPRLTTCEKRQYGPTSTPKVINPPIKTPPLDAKRTGWKVNGLERKNILQIWGYHDITINISFWYVTPCALVQPIGFSEEPDTTIAAGSSETLHHRTYRLEKVKPPHKPLFYTTSSSPPLGPSERPIQGALGIFFRW